MTANAGVKKYGVNRRPVDKKVRLKKTTLHILKVALRTAFLIGMGYVMLYPILYMLSSAFKDAADVYDPTVIWIPKHYSLTAMKLALQYLHYGKSILSTLKMLVPCVAFQIVSTLFAAYGFARFRFKERGIYMGILIFTIIVPVQTIILPLYCNFYSAKLIGSYWPMYLMALLGMGIRSGLYIMIMRQFFKNMPMELEEASMIDGCGPIKTFLVIMLPNVIPAMVTILVFSIVWYWNDYYQSMMFLQTQAPLSVQMTDLGSLVDSAGQNLSWITTQDLWLLHESVLVCGCLLVMAPLLVMYILLQRFFVESVERTGIVG